MNAPRRAHGVAFATAVLVAGMAFTASHAIAAEPPTIDIGPPDGAALQAPPTYTLSTPAPTLNWTLDGPSALAVQTGTVSPAVLTVGGPDGLYTFSATATDAEGESLPTTTTYRLDTTGPVISLTGPADGATTNDTTPTFSWSATDSSGVATQQIQIDANPPLVSQANPFTASLDEGGPYTWQVTATDSLGNPSVSGRTIEIDTTPPKGGSISLPGLTNSPTVNLTGSAGSSDPHPPITYALSGSATPPAPAPGEFSASLPTTFSLPAGDGQKTVHLWAKDAPGNAAAVASASTVLDTTPPSAPTITRQPDAISPPGTPLVFAWTGDGNPTIGLGRFNWEVRDSSGQVDASGSLDATTGSGQVAVRGLAHSDSYVFRVQQIDRAGNVGQVSQGAVFAIVLPPSLPGTPTSSPGSGSGRGSSSSAAPTIVPVAGAPAAPAASAGTQRIAPGTLNAKRLRPKSGAPISGLRPRLRWPRTSKATVYNVQIFRMVGTRFIKVYSGFPKTNRLRVPAGKLKRGERYAWRVWPFRGRKALKNPIGASYFDVRTKGQIFAHRLLRPGDEIVTGERTQFRWRKRAGVKQYRFRLLKDGERMYQGITRRNRSTVPARRLAEAGDYRVLVQLGVGRPKARKFGAAWIRLPIEVLTQTQLAARRGAENG